MRQYILFFDIDGTLIDSFNGGSRLISEPLKEALKQLKNQGHLCFIATGRPLGYMNKDLLEQGFDGYLLCNGGIVIKDQKILIEKLFPKDKVKEIVDVLVKNKNGYFLNYLTDVYSSKNNFEYNKLFGSEVIQNGTIYYDFKLEDLTVSKFEIREVKEDTLTYLRELNNQGYELVEYPRLEYAELTMPGATKGNTILEILKILNIPVENSIAFGDGENDIEMLKVVGHGVAMGNAIDLVKENADSITESCKDEGIVKELQRLGLVKGIIE